MREVISAWLAKTKARPRLRISLGEAALGLITAPPGAMLPRSTAKELPSVTGLESGRMTSSLYTLAYAILSPNVWPFTVRHSMRRYPFRRLSKAVMPPA